MDLEKLRRNIAAKENSASPAPATRNQVDKATTTAEKLRLLYGGQPGKKDLLGRRNATPEEVSKILKWTKPPDQE